jgi:ribosomal protein S18 acetylase RimI-like enzyme
VLAEFEILQLVATGDAPANDSADPGVVPLHAADVPQMLDLVARTEPGPFRPRTRELGTYLGIRDGDALIAMAGERIRVPGYTEISAVCTDPAYRRQGLAARVIRSVAAGIRARGDVPFLHVIPTNPALHLYLSLGFEHRRDLHFTVLQAPV